MTTILSHQHAILLCACGRILSQCRCMDPGKVRQVVAQDCSACRRAPALTFPMQTFIWDDAPVRGIDSWPHARRQAIVGPPPPRGFAPEDYV